MNIAPKAGCFGGSGFACGYALLMQNYVISGANPQGREVEMTITASDVAGAVKASQTLGLRQVVVTTVLDDHLPTSGASAVPQTTALHGG